MNAGLLEKRKELRKGAVGKILSKIDDVADRLLTSGDDKDVGWEGTASRDTTVICGQDCYRAIVTVKLIKFSTED